MAGERYYSRATSGINYFGAARTEPSMRDELIHTFDGNFPEIAKAQTVLLRRMRRTSGVLDACSCVDHLTHEPDKDRFCPICVKWNTYVPTSRGVKQIYEILPGESVLAADGQYHQVTDIHSRLYHGSMVEISTRGRKGTPLELTADHPVFVFRPTALCHHKKSKDKLCNPQLCQVASCKSKNKGFQLDIQQLRADQIKPSDYLCVPRMLDNVTQNQVLEIDWTRYHTGNGKIPQQLPKSLSADHDLVTFLGWYVAEGSGDAPSRKSRGVIFSLHEKERSIGQQLLDIAKRKFGLSGKIESVAQGHGIRVVIYSAALSRWLHELCGRYSDYKQVPVFIWSLTPDLQQTFLKAFIEGDGHRDVDSIVTVGIASRRLAEEIYLLALLNGFFPILFTYKEKDTTDGVHHQRVWCIEWLDSQSNTPEKIPAKWRCRFPYNNFLFSQVRQITHKVDTCAVCDLSVAEQHSFIANGILVHNCFGEGYYWDESYVQIYKVNLGNEVRNALLPRLESFGNLAFPLTTFYLRYDVEMDNSDKLVEIQLESDGSVSSPVTRTRIYKIGNIFYYRADDGRLEYIKIWASEDNVKYLMPPAFGEV